MFTLANFVLLALFLAAAVDFALALRAAAPGPGRARRAFAALWRTPHLLYGPWGALWRERLGQALFLGGVALYEFTVVFCNSMARENWPWVQTTLGAALEWVYFGCFAAKILLGTRYNWQNLGLAGCLYFIARWVYFNGQSIWWIGVVLVVLAAKDVPLTKAAGAFLASGLPTLALVFTLHFAGVIAPDALSERAGSYRRMFGYGHPNTLGGLVFGLALAWVLWRRSRLRWADCALLGAVGVFLLVGPASRSSALCVLGLAALLALVLARRTLHRPALARPRLAGGLLAALVPLVAAVSYILPLFVVKIGPWNDEIGPTWLARLDSLLTCRISLSWTGYRLFDVKIAGQILPELPALDNTFVYMLYQFGPVAAALLALGLMVTLYRLARARRWPEVFCLVAVLFYGYMENQVLHFTSDPAALLLCATVFALPVEPAASPQNR